MKKQTTFYLVRHAQAQGNVDKFFQGRFDGKVSALGEKQILELKQSAEKFSPDVIVSSPLTRAADTAKALQHKNQPLLFDDRLIEIDGGSWEGKPWASFRKDDPVRAAAWDQTPWSFCAPGGESMKQVFDRAVEAITEYRERFAGKTVALVSHGCWIRCAMTWAKGYELTQMDRVSFCDNTAVSSFVMDEDGKITWKSENDTSHLSDRHRVSIREMFTEKEE